MKLVGGGREFRETLGSMKVIVARAEPCCRCGGGGYGSRRNVVMRRGRYAATPFPEPQILFSPGDERICEKCPEKISERSKLQFPEPGGEESGARMIVAKQASLAPFENKAVSVPVWQEVFDRSRLGEYAGKALGDLRVA